MRGVLVANTWRAAGGACRDAREVAVADVLLAQTRCARVHSLSCDDIQHELQVRVAACRALHAVAHSNAHTAGCTAEQVDTAGSKECRIAEGYSNLLQRYSNGLKVQLNGPVTCVRWGRQQPAQCSGPASASSAVCVTTADGAQHAADAVVVTASVAALAAAGIRFEPALSAAKAAALSSLRMEPATKLIYWFRRQLWPDELTFMCHTGKRAAVCACHALASCMWGARSC